jgi:hypothetical protein
VAINISDILKQLAEVSRETNKTPLEIMFELASTAAVLYRTERINGHVDVPFRHIFDICVKNFDAAARMLEEVTKILDRSGRYLNRYEGVGNFNIDFEEHIFSCTVIPVKSMNLRNIQIELGPNYIQLSGIRRIAELSDATIPSHFRLREVCNVAEKHMAHTYRNLPFTSLIVDARKLASASGYDNSKLHSYSHAEIRLMVVFRTVNSRCVPTIDKFTELMDEAEKIVKAPLESSQSQ